VKIFAAGTRAIRAHDSGIEIYDITPAAVPKLGAASGGLSSSGTAITGNAAGTQAVRTYSGGIEVYSLVPQTNPTWVASFTTVALSSTGVGVCVKGTSAFRATDSSVEAFDISAAATGTTTPLGQTPATLSSTGVGPTCRFPFRLRHYGGVTTSVQEILGDDWSFRGISSSQKTNYVARSSTMLDES
jgi:hypothetical protein